MFELEDRFTNIGINFAKIFFFCASLKSIPTLFFPLVVLPFLSLVEELLCSMATDCNVTNLALT